MSPSNINRSEVTSSVLLFDNIAYKYRSDSLGFPVNGFLHWVKTGTVIAAK